MNDPKQAAKNFAKLMKNTTVKKLPVLNDSYAVCKNKLGNGLLGAVDGVNHYSHISIIILPEKQFNKI